MMEWVRTIDQLGFLPEDARAYRDCMRADRGLVVIGGQRESGITTTMYAGLREIFDASKARRIVTIEDPIAYPLHGVTQLAVDAKAGFFFDDGIDIARREHADVIMVGGLFSPVTVEKALEAARSCLVLSSLFCMAPSDVASQLVAQGASPAAIEEVLLGVFVQELVVKVRSWTPSR